MYLRLLKRKLTFFLGFFIGFIITLYLASIFNNCNYKDCHGKSLKLKNKNTFVVNKKLTIRGVKSSDRDINLPEDDFIEDPQKIKYQKWLRGYNITLSKINLDHQYYGSLFESNYTSSSLESDWLKSKINIVCVVFVEKIKLAKAIYNTWSKNCNKVYFFSHKVTDSGSDPSIVKLSVKITSSWQLLCESLHHVWKSLNDSLQWVIVIKDDTMILLENLRYYVAPLDYNDGHYLGHPVVLWGQAYNVAQAGYVLSRGAVEKVISHFNTHEKCLAGGKYWKQEDYYLGKHLAALNIQPSDTRDHKLRDIFHGYPLQTLLWGLNKLGNYFTRAVYPSRGDCCSPRSVTFSVPDAERLYTINYYLYHLFVHNRGIYGNKPAPTPVPEQEVWKLALKDEFNITYFDNITNEVYYKIWRFKYVDPINLKLMTNKEYINGSDIFEALWSKQESERVKRN
ncbi:GSCOCG00003288001-RA-CDS [Cotesia congregata]|uniref:Similar to C1GALT1: Glycoprotein-N-acetylgalactosamine 3-beta-galactosyltransferase 1 (Gallus gallus) n=1 Tax=Cotesia congregata TaxID=51543 RepID=A0A8J2HTK0_COTCN|nr:GSCOCG00003288001-RA-CDS [Cotesia congregata]CAG5108322.1 Similar to C1GALT1: Glycoprotein-N-acetylgalactosamine 3-beta-galactosyltransferase 1 (Gallus gallus) [Cotesia congregata]